MRKRATSVGLVAVLVGLLCAVAPTNSAVAGTTTVPRPDHVVIVVEENRSAQNVIGNPDAPYITSLAQQNANFTRSFALTHPSQPNYIGLFSGSTQGVTDDSCPHSFAAPSLGDQLIASGHTFAGYSESLPSVGFTGCTSGKYVAKHSPWVNFPSLPASTNQPLTAFPTDFNDLPDVSFVIPNLDNDMHDGTIAQGDAWLQSHLGDYVTWAKTHNSLFVLTFDEDDFSEANRIPTIMAGQRVTPGTYTETIDHYDVLRTLQDAFGLAPLGNSAVADPILDVWNPGDGNLGPHAAFTSTCNVLSCSFDASGSSDPDGTVTQYTWDFGDGTSGTGASPNHTFAGSGTYPVKLTVADDGGATDAVTHDVAVTAPPNAPFVVDTYARTVTNGWGAANVGGAWSLTGTASAFSVAGGAGSIRHATAGSQVTATMGAVSRSDTDLTFGFNVDKLTAGYYLTATGRRVSAGNEYRARALVTSANKVTVMLTRLVGGAQTSISTDRSVTGLTYTAGMPLRMRVQVTGTSPTTVRAKVWPASATEPPDWLVSATDSTAGLQGPGAIALTSYLSGNATNAPAVARISDLSARPTAPPQNQPPTARFTSSCTGLGCGFDATTSSDPEGAVSYAWTFGDGGTGSGAQPSHTFPATGAYDVTLTVTDAGGLTDSVTHQVSVTAPVGQPSAVDTFARTVSNGWGSADVGGAWSLTGTASAFSVGGGAGMIRHAVAGSQVTAALAGASSADTDLTFGFNVDKLSAGYYLTVAGRRVSANNEYRARVLVGSTNKVSVMLVKVVAGTQTTIAADKTVTGLTYAPGMALRVRMQVSGISPTTVRAKVWPATDAEPASWLTTATDSTTGLQAPGGIALTSYLSSAATNAPLVARFSDLTARPGP